MRATDVSSAAVTPYDRCVQRLRRRWPLPLLVTVLVAGAVYLGAAMAPPVYVSRSVLELSSTKVTPDREAALARGYIDFFNQPSTQEALRRQVGIDGAPVLTARLAAVSPIIYVEATADQPQAAEDVVVKVSTAFRDRIERSLATSASASASTTSGAKPSSTTVSTISAHDGAVRVPTGAARPVGNAAAIAALISVIVACSVPEIRVRGRTV